MKASEMTNEMLAHNLEATIPFLMEEARHLTDADEIMTEAAARLRKMDAVAMALNIEVGMNKAAAKITVALSDKLKAAEDALEKVYKCIDNRYGVDASLLAKNIIADALAAIREDGGAK